MKRTSRISVRLAGMSAIVALTGSGVLAFPAHAQPAPAPATLTATAGGSPTTARAQVRARPGVKVSSVKISDRGRLVSARVSWNRKLAALPGKRHRYNVRLLAVPLDPSAQPVVLHDQSDAVVPSMDHNVHIKLSNGQSKVLRRARDVVFSVSQQYGRPTRGNKLYERNFVNTTHLRRSARASSAARVGVGANVEPSPRSVYASKASKEMVSDPCSQAVGPGVRMSGCRDMFGANLSNADLSTALLDGALLTKANLSGANLTATDLSGADLSGANLTGADLTGANVSDTICGSSWDEDGGMDGSGQWITTRWTGGTFVLGPTCPAS